jgi:hypothetical protein
MARNGLSLRLDQPYLHFYPQVRRSPIEAAKSQHQMTRTLIWDQVNPTSSRPPLEQGWLIFDVGAFTILGVQAPPLNATTHFTNPRTFECSCGRGFVRCSPAATLKWPSPVKLITSPNLNLRVSFLRFSSRSFPGLLLWSIHCSHQQSLASYPRFVTLHILSVLTHFRSSSLTYLNYLLCCCQDGEFLFPNSLSARNQERIYVTTRLQEQLSSSYLYCVLQGELDISWSLS